MKLFCPKCGDQLAQDENGHFECVRGQMPLSLRLERQLCDCYVSQVRRPRDMTFTYGGQPHTVGGDWYCPGCGVLIQELSPGDLRCPICSQSIVEFIHSLIELHPHFDGARWR
jgi:hypothetical protein